LYLSHLFHFSLHDALPILFPFTGFCSTIVNIIVKWIAVRYGRATFESKIWPCVVATIPVDPGKPFNVVGMGVLVVWGIANDGIRSEEHTSELQSRENLVCR